MLQTGTWAAVEFAQKVESGLIFSTDTFILSPALCLGMKQTLSSPCEKSWSRECVLAEPDWKGWGKSIQEK